MDTSAVITICSLVVAFLGYCVIRDIRDRRFAIERQDMCHSFHRELNQETTKAFTMVAGALHEYTTALAAQAERHKDREDLHRALVQVEMLQAEIKELKGPINKV